MNKFNNFFVENVFRLCFLYKFAELKINQKKMKKLVIRIFLLGIMFSFQMSSFSINANASALEIAIEKIQNNNFRGALKDLNVALSESPNNPEIYYYRAVALLSLNKNSQAIEDLSIALALNHKSAKYYHLRAVAYADQDDLQPAYRDMDKAIEIDVNNADFYLMRAEIEMALNYTMNAVQNFEKAARLGSAKAKDYLMKNQL